MSMFETMFELADLRPVKDEWGRIQQRWVRTGNTFGGILGSTDPNERVKYSQQTHIATDSISIFGPCPITASEGDRIVTHTGKVLYITRIVDPGDIGYRCVLYCEYVPGEVIPP